MPGEQKSREAAHEFGRERPVVVILVGAPGQGKSSVAAKIKAAAGAVDVANYLLLFFATTFGLSD